MTWYEDLGRESRLVSGPRIRTVGWLAAGHPYTWGEVSPVTLSKLKRLCTTWVDSARVLRWNAEKGRFACAFCGLRGQKGTFGVPGERVLYVAPHMIWHYCHAHGYLPPRAFTDAVERCPEFATKAYAERVRDFSGPPVVVRFRPTLRRAVLERRR
jgi:hypothetical protein